MQKYTYYARPDENGPIVMLFSLFSPREPTAEEIAAFQQQVMAQNRQIQMPKPTFVSVEELHEIQAEPPTVAPPPVILARSDGMVH